MKSFVAISFIVCVLAFIAQSAALPVVEADVAETNAEETYAVDENAVIADVEQHVVSRQKRATCDLLSFTGVNHAACAAHCVVKGFRGGYCNGKAVCVCRR